MALPGSAGSRCLRCPWTTRAARISGITCSCPSATSAPVTDELVDHIHLVARVHRDACQSTSLPHDYAQDPPKSRAGVLLTHWPLRSDGSLRGFERDAEPHCRL